MTDTERTRKRRERLRQERGPQSPAAIIDALRKENAALRRQQATKDEPAAAPKATDADRRKLESELLKVRLENDRLREQLSAKAEPATMSLDMISTKTGREQAEVFMRQYAKRTEAESGSSCTPSTRRGWLN